MQNILLIRKTGDEKQKERTTAKKKMAESLQQLYEEKVPEAVREYLERKNPPAARPRRPRPQKETKKEEAPAEPGAEQHHE